IMDVRTNPLTPSTLRRLRAMSFTEIAYRGRQEASKAFDRLAPGAPTADSRGWARAHAPSLDAPGAARALEPARCARPGHRRRQQGRLGDQPPSMAGAVGAGVDPHAGHALRL